MRSLRKLNLFGDDAQLHHVGVAVASIRDALGSDVAITRDERQRVFVAFGEVGGTTLEFIEPLPGASPVRASLEKGQHLVHLCFTVLDLDQALRIGRENGFHSITRPVEAPAFGGRRIVWVFNPILGLVELLERGTVKPETSID